MGRTNLTTPGPNPTETSKKPRISKPPVSKKKEKKGKNVVVLHVKSDSSGRHYGRTSEDPTRFYMAPSSVSRADGDLDKDSPPPSPRAEENIFTQAKGYELEGPLRNPSAADRALHAELSDKGKWPIPLLYPDIEGLTELKMLDEVSIPLRNCGLGFIFQDDPGSYHELTMEFLSSFDAVFKYGDDGVEEEIKSWRFFMGEWQWEIDANVLRDWFRMPRDGRVPVIDDEEVRGFWKRVTGLNYYDKGQHKATHIRVPKWSLILKFVAGSILVRSNYGRIVRKEELMMATMIEKGQKIDWLWVLTKELKEYQIVSSKSQGLGGGSFVTKIAKKLNFKFGRAKSVKLKLTLKKMQSMRILGKGMKLNRNDEEFAPEEEDDDDDIDGYAHPDAPSSSRSAPPPRASSDPSLASLISQFDSQAREQRDHNAYVSRHFQWQQQHAQWNERTLLTIATHMGIASSIGPPPLPPMDPAADPTAGLSDLEGSL